MTDSPTRLKVLFLCTGNSCRSQMAEGWSKQLRSDVIDAHSAGTDPHGLNERAIHAMAEAGVDISGQWSKHVDELSDIAFDVVVTVCDSAHEHCPVYLADSQSGVRIVHRGFDDPPRLAHGAASEAEAMAHYTRVRDEIRAFVELLPEALSPINATE